MRQAESSSVLAQVGQILTVKRPETEDIARSVVSRPIRGKKNPNEMMRIGNSSPNPC